MMSESTLEQTIADTGYAKVLLKLKRPGISVETALSANGLQRLLERTLLAPDPGQTAGLAAAFATSVHPSMEVALAAPPPKEKIYPRLGLAIGYADRAALSTLAASDQIETIKAAPE